MDGTSEKQTENGDVRARIRALGLTQARIARELNRSEGAITRALNGERKILLGRILRFLDRYERVQAKRKAA